MSTVSLHFDAPLSEANLLAEELQEYIKAFYGVRLIRTKANRAFMDAGSILTIVLTAPSVAAVGVGLKIWLSKKKGIKIFFKDKNMTVIGTGMAGKELPSFFSGIAKLQKDDTGKP